MKKAKVNQILFFVLLIYLYSFGYDIDNLGLDDTDTLNNHEHEHLVELFNESNLTSDSLPDNHSIRYVFVTGSSGGRIIGKKEFFSECILPWIKKEQYPVVGISMLSKDEQD